MMVMFSAGICDLCGKARPMATPEQCKAAGLDLDAAVCVECLKNANPAIVDGNELRRTVRAAVPAGRPIVIVNSADSAGESLKIAAGPIPDDAASARAVLRVSARKPS